MLWYHGHLLILVFINSLLFYVFSWMKKKKKQQQKKKHEIKLKILAWYLR